MIRKYLKYQKITIENDVVFEANDVELEGLKEEGLKETNDNIKPTDVIKKFINLGWAKNELLRILPAETKKYFSRRSFFLILYISLIILLLTFILIVEINNQSESIIGNFSSLATIMFYVFIILLIIKLLPHHKKTIMDRRAILFLNRIQKQFAIKNFDDAEKTFSKIKEHNPKKFFVPEKNIVNLRFSGEGACIKTKNLMYT